MLRMERAGPPFPLRPLCSAYRAVARGKRGIGKAGRQLDIHVQLDLACTVTNISTLQPPRSRHRAATRGRRGRISPTVNPSAYTGEDCAAAHTSRHKASDPQRAQLQQHQSVEQMETSTEERISALQKRLGALQHLAGGRDESAPHYYVTGEYGNKYDEVFNKLFAPGDPTPIHARGGLFESPDAHPLPGKRMITRIHKIQLSGNITCTNCFFLGQNSKVVINNWAGNATDIGDEEEASIFDDAESLEQPSRGQQLRIVPHHKSLQSRLRDEHLLKMQRARVRARVLRARREAAAERSEGVRERKEDSLERAQRAARTLAAAEAKAGEDALKQQSRAERGKQDKFTKLQRVEMSTRALTRAEKAVATSNDILKLRLAALHSTEQLFQVPLPLSLRSALVDA